MADFLDEKRKEIQARLKELRPLVDEFHRLEAAERALSGVGSTAAPAAASPRRTPPRRPPPPRPGAPPPPPRAPFPRLSQRPPGAPARLRHPCPRGAQA